MVDNIHLTILGFLSEFVKSLPFFFFFLNASDRGLDRNKKEFPHLFIFVFLYFIVIHICIIFCITFCMCVKNDVFFS